MAFTRAALPLAMLVLLCSAFGAFAAVPIFAPVCMKSTLAPWYQKMVKVKPGVFFHWTNVGGKTLNAALQATKQSGVSGGWLSVGFAKPGPRMASMIGSDAVVGNQGGKGATAYNMKSITKAGVKPSPNFVITEASSVSDGKGGTLVKFSRTAKGNVPFNFAGKNNMLWAHATGPVKAFNTHSPKNRGAFSIDLAKCK